MPMELIQKTTLELQAMNYHGRWSPYIYNEPLRDERLLAIIAFVHSHVPRASIMINTNADYLTEKYLDALFKAGVNQLALNVYSARDGHKDPANVESGIRIAKARAAVLQKWLDKRRWIDQNSSLYTHCSTKAKIAKVQHKYGVQKDGTNFGGGFELQNRSGNVEWLDTKDETYSGMCVRPFRDMMVNWKGDAILCCNDYHGEVAFGNIADNTLEELWNKMQLHRIRAQLQDGVRKGICEHCDYKGGAYKHNVAHVQLTRKK